MSERAKFRAWCESLTEPDWLIAQTSEEAFFLGAWAAWRYCRADIAEANERAEAAESRLAALSALDAWARNREEIHRRKVGTPCCCDFDDDDTPLTECNHHRSIREERDAAIARADALAARLAEVEDRERPA